MKDPLATGEQPSSTRRRVGATLADVARVAEVSSATVSRALNTPDLLTKDTLARVHRAIAETGYIPNLSVGPVMTNRSRLIGMLLPPVNLGIFDDTIRALIGTLDGAGYQALFGIYSRDATREQLVTQILSRRPSGLILIGLPILPNIRELLLEAALPIVETWEVPREPLDMVCGVSHADLGMAMGQYVLRKGWKRPFLLSMSNVQAAARRYGISRVLMESGMEEPPFLNAERFDMVSEGRRIIAEVLARGGERPDVIVCASDWLAFGAMIELQAQGIKVPRDCAVIGNGDVEFAASLVPALTTFRVDGRQMGVQAGEMMLQALSGKRPKKRIVDLGFELIERESS
jgi:LacI family gluconate utilization system Gnt-I transcriptional repressor